MFGWVGCLDTAFCYISMTLAQYYKNHIPTFGIRLHNIHTNENICMFTWQVMCTKALTSSTSVMARAFTHTTARGPCTGDNIKTASATDTASTPSAMGMCMKVRKGRREGGIFTHSSSLLLMLMLMMDLLVGGGGCR